MRLLIVGAGAVGGYFGARLLEAGVAVSFLVRPSRAQQLVQDGLAVTSPFGDICIPRPAVVSAATEKYSAILLACKAYDLEQATTAIRPAVAADTLILPLLNGLAHLQALDNAFGLNAVAGGECQIGVDLQANGVIRHLNNIHLILMGARSSTQLRTIEQLHEVFQSAKFESQISDDILQDLWEKFVFITTLAGSTCLFRGALHEILATNDGQMLISELLSCCVETATRQGHPPRAAFLQRISAELTDPNSTWTSSMLRDIWRQAPTEAEHVLGDMLRLAEQVAVPDRLLRTALTQLRVYEIRRQSMQPPA